MERNGGNGGKWKCKEEEMKERKKEGEFEGGKCDIWMD
jgi:hypothetical protein